ncbi:MAG: hypothetical protein L6R36_004911 [Xanthoria steineri]|nr:MAG: hypothetical protein L6R36_004911 [Xanthoria steineri]
MALSKVLLLSLALSVRGQIFKDTNQGWCYFCSTDNAPPLCNSQCETAIEKVCKSENRNIGLTAIEGDCEVNYFPPVAAKANAKTQLVTPDNCRTSFKRILYKCGRDAADPNPNYNSSYCTGSAGGGTNGWNDDGSPMTGTGRYTITTKNTNQCGQNEAIEKLATNIIQWDPKWISPTDQVIYDANPPPLADFPKPPEPNPICDQVTCDIFDKPYYASKGPPGIGKPNWIEKSGYVRHQVFWAGWADDSPATEFYNALVNRCPVAPYNWRPYMNATTSHIADFELPHSAQDDHCWCIADAIYDASGGIKMDRNTWCEDVPTTQSVPEFTPLDGAEADADQCPIGPNGAAPAQCAAPPDINPNQAPANPAPGAPATDPNQAPANQAQPPPSSKKFKRSPEDERMRKRHLDSIGPLFRMIGDEQPATPPPKTPRRMRRTGAWW